MRDYENFLLHKGERTEQAEAAGDQDAPQGPATIVSVRQLADRPEPIYHHREPWTLEIEWRTTDPSLPFHVGVGIDRVDGVQVCASAVTATGCRRGSARIVIGHG